MPGREVFPADFDNNEGTRRVPFNKVNQDAVRCCLAGVGLDCSSATGSDASSLASCASGSAFAVFNNWFYFTRLCFIDGLAIHLDQADKQQASLEALLQVDLFYRLSRR